MTRKTWLLVLGLMSLAGCKSNPYRPTMFQRMSGTTGPEMIVPSGQEGPYLGGDASGGYPMTPGGMAPSQGYPQPGTFPPPGNFVPPPSGSTNPPIQGFPPTMPPAPGGLPQGPPPRAVTNGTSR